MTATPSTDRVDYQTDPSRYRHWKLSFEGPVATLAADFDENGGLRPGYKLKLNSYDLGVDIELHDAVNRIRFEHPEVRTVVVTSAKDKVFCSGANIFMLGVSSHAWKVNFCKFTNETRNGLEDSSAHSGLKFLAAVNGACAGGGYELALACDEILMVNDRSSTVSLPEAERVTLDFLAQYVPAGKSPMCGNSICQDRRFLHREMPALERFFHYRNLDVSTLKELARRWAPAVASGLRKESAHLALSDIRDSIAELRWYRQHMGALGG